MESQLQILLSIARSKKHGYQIIKETGINGTTLYRTIAKMVEQGIVREASGDGDKRRIYYSITESGKNVLIEEVKRMETAIQQIKMALENN